MSPHVSDEGRDRDLTRFRVTLLVDVDEEDEAQPDEWNWAELIGVHPDRVAVEDCEPVEEET